MLSKRSHSSIISFFVKIIHLIYFLRTLLEIIPVQANSDNPEMKVMKFMGPVHTRIGCSHLLSVYYFPVWLILWPLIFVLIDWLQINAIFFCYVRAAPSSVSPVGYIFALCVNVFDHWGLTLSAGFQLGFMTFLKRGGMRHKKEAITQVTRSNNIIVVMDGLL